MSYSFDGANDYLHTSTLPVSNYPFSVVLWVKRHTYGTVSDCGWSMGTATSGNGRVGLEFDPSGTPYIIRVSDAGTSDTTYTSGATVDVTQNEWDCIATVFTSTGSCTVYGADGTSVSDTTTIGATISGMDTFRLGITPSGGRDYDGQIAHVAVWSSALGSSDVASLITGASPLGIQSASLVAYWPLAADLNDDKGTNNLTAAGNAALVAPADDPTISAYTTKKLKLLASSGAQGVTGVTGHVFNATETSYIGKFTGAAFGADLVDGDAVLKVAVSEFNGSSLTTSDTPVTFIYSSTEASIGPADCTVIEE